MADLVQGNVKVQISTGSPAAFVDIPGVTNASYAGAAPREIDATDFDTTAGETETLYANRPNAPLTFQMHLDPANVTQELLFTAAGANTNVTVRLKAKTKATTFIGKVVIGESHSVDGKLTSDVSILPNARPQRTTVS